MRILGALFLFALTALAQYKTEAGGAPSTALKPDLVKQLQPQGVKILRADGSVLCEVWLRASSPGTAAVEEAATFGIPQGALLGAIHFPAKHEDRRGQTIQPGVYTLRYSMFPVNGDHQGVAPQRDFVLITPAADDSDPAATPNFETLVRWSRKASGTPHPAVFSIWKQEPGDFRAGFDKVGDHDWAFQGKLNDLLFAMILVGRAEG
jgi:hypothetical protein